MVPSHPQILNCHLQQAAQLPGKVLLRIKLFLQKFLTIF